MENFFCELNSVQNLIKKLGTDFQNEKIALLVENNNFANAILLNLSKTNIIETDSSKINNESVKAVVCFGGCVFFNNVLTNCCTNKKIYLVFNQLNELLNFKNINSNLIFVLNSNFVINKFEKIKNYIFEYCAKCLISIQDEFVRNLVNLKSTDFCNLKLKSIIDLLMYFEKNDEINIYNYNSFAKLVKNCVNQKLLNKTSIVERTVKIYRNFEKTSINELQSSFVISYIFHKFIKNRNFIKLKCDCFYKKLQFHKKYLSNLFQQNDIVNSYFSFIENETILSKLKGNYLIILKFCEKIFKLNCYLLKNSFFKNESKINAKIFINSLCYASDYDDCGIATIMRNLGYLSVD